MRTNRMQFYQRLIVSVLIVNLCSGCWGYEYVNHMPQEPMFTDKNQVQAAAGAGYNHVDLQMAFSPLRKFGIGSTVFLASETYSYEAKLFYYRSICKSLRIGLSGSYVNANVNSQDGNYGEYSDQHSSQATYSGFNGQLSWYGVNVFKNFGIAFSTKYSRVFYENYRRTESRYVPGSPSRAITTYRFQNRFFSDVTNFLTVRKHWGHTFVFGQVGLSLPLDSIDAIRDLENQSGRSGVIVRISPDYHYLILNVGVGLGLFKIEKEVWH